MNEITHHVIDEVTSQDFETLVRLWRQSYPFSAQVDTSHDEDFIRYLLSLESRLLAVARHQDKIISAILVSLLSDSTQEWMSSQVEFCRHMEWNISRAYTSRFWISDPEYRGKGINQEFCLYGDRAMFQRADINIFDCLTGPKEKGGMIDYYIRLGYHLAPEPWTTRDGNPGEYALFYKTRWQDML
jgi:ribosomal protein S18 acetylase RimI-like enzyme